MDKWRYDTWTLPKADNSLFSLDSPSTLASYIHKTCRDFWKRYTPTALFGLLGQFPTAINIIKKKETPATSQYLL